MPSPPEDEIRFLAGPQALRRIRANGLSPGDVRVVAGAAGGPKWLIFGHLDRFLFTRWFVGRRRPLFLVGASSGAWRFSAAARNDPEEAIGALEAAYIAQRYRRRPTPEEVSDACRRIQRQYLGWTGAREIPAHPFLRLNVLVARCRGAGAWDLRPLLLLSLATSGALNFISRRLLGLFYDRTLVHDPRDRPPFFAAGGFPLRRIPLTTQNCREALLASGSIPLLMSGVRNLAGGPPGTYRDGGLLDYHLDLPLTGRGGGIALYPHYGERIVPGWFDKPLSRRRAAASRLASTLVVAPGPRFLQRLPYGKIPDRKDFWRFAGDDEARFRYWRAAAAAGRRLAEGFRRAVESGSIRRRVRPLALTEDRGPAAGGA